MSTNSSTYLRGMQPSLGWNKQTVLLSQNNSIGKQKPVLSQNYSRGLIEYDVSSEESHKPSNFLWLPGPFSRSLFLKNQRHGANFPPNNPYLMIACLVLLLKTFQPLYVIPQTCMSCISEGKVSSIFWAMFPHF